MEFHGELREFLNFSSLGVCVRSHTAKDLPLLWDMYVFILLNIALTDVVTFAGHRRNIQDLSAISSPHHSRNRQKLLNRGTIYRVISKHIFCDRICLRLNAFRQFRFRFG